MIRLTSRHFSYIGVGKMKYEYNDGEWRCKFEIEEPEEAKWERHLEKILLVRSYGFSYDPECRGWVAPGCLITKATIKSHSLEELTAYLDYWGASLDRYTEKEPEVQMTLTEEESEAVVQKLTWLPTEDFVYTPQETSEDILKRIKGNL